MGSESEQLERNIAQSREQLGRDVDLLTEKISPKAAARRGVGRVRTAATSVRETVMGRTSDGADTAGSKVSEWSHQAGQAAAGAKDSVADAAQTATQTVRQGTTGNPLAAGVIAFGVGWLASTVIPASRAEKRLGRSLQETARERGGMVRDQVSAAASEIAENLREPARDAAEQVRQSTAQAAGTVKDEVAGQASEVADEAQQAGQAVAETARTGGAQRPDLTGSGGQSPAPAGSGGQRPAPADGGRRSAAKAPGQPAPRRPAPPSRTVPPPPGPGRTSP